VHKPFVLRFLINMCYIVSVFVFELVSSLINNKIEDKTGNLFLNIKIVKAEEST
jgi:hypothetical protein